MPKSYEFSPLMICEELNHEMVKCLRTYFDRHIIKDQNNEGQEIRYLMSWEGFSGNFRSGYANAGIVAEHIKRATEGLDVYIIVYLRRQDAFVESLYTQQIHKGESFSFEAFVDSLPAFSFDWEQFLESYAAIFGIDKVVARRYDKAFFPGADSLLKDFFQVIGVDFADVNSQKDLIIRNPGYSRNALEIARLSNPYLDSDEKKLLRKVLQQISAKQPFENYTFWSDQKREKFLAQHLESNARVAEKYFDEFTGILFPPEPHKDKDVFQGLVIENTVPIIVKAMLSRKQSTREQSAREQSGELPFAVRLIAKAERKIIALLKKSPWLFSKVQALSRKLGV